MGPKRILCKEILAIEIVSNAFKNNLSDLSNKIISCFYSCFQQIFNKWALITYSSYPEDFIAFISGSSFTDGVLKFKETVSNSGIYDGKASLQTILFGFCRMSFKENLQREKRLLDKNKIIAPVIVGNGISDNGEEQDLNEKLLMALKLALEKAEATDRQIIIWRHIEEKSNDEIAKLLGITVESATNRIYRCMVRLRKMTENIHTI